MKFVRYSIAVLLMAGAVLAQQGPPGRQRHGMAGDQAAQSRGVPQALADYLKLTADQEAQLRAVQTSLREAIQPLAEQLRAKSTELRNATKQDPVEATTVTRLRADVKKLREDIRSQRDGFAAKSRQVLSAEQQKSLEALEQALSLQAAARQAAFLGLITPPENADEWGYGGAGRGMMGRRPAPVR